MPIPTQCPGCDSEYTVPNSLAGRTMSCPACSMTVRIPAAPPIVEPDPLPTPAPVAVESTPEPEVIPTAVVLPAPTVPSKPIPYSDASPITIALLVATIGLLMLLLGGGVVYMFLSSSSTSVARATTDQLQPTKQTIVRTMPETTPVLPGPSKGEQAARVDRVDLGIRPPKLKEAKTLELPGDIGWTAVGGHGRYIFLTIPSKQQLAIYDANEARVVKYLSLKEDRALIAAGATKLFIGLPDAGIIERYSIGDFKKELTTKAPSANRMHWLTMGSGSEGPLFVASNNRNDQFAGHLGGLDVLDIKTMSPLFDEKNHRDMVNLAEIVLVSADGRVAAIDGSNGLGALTVDGNRGRVKFADNANGIRTMLGQPGPDGRYIYTVPGGVLGSDLRPVSRANFMRQYVPAVHGPYCLSFESQHRFNRGQVGVPSLALHLAGDSSSLLTLPDIRLPDEANFDPRFDPDFGRGLPRLPFSDLPSQHLHLIPQANSIVITQLGKDRIEVHPIDIQQALDKSGVDYLYVDSQAPVHAQPGRSFDYQLSARSKKGGVSYRLDSGPEGMSITPDGQLRWNVPGDFAGNEMVVVTVADKSGQERLHSFQLAALSPSVRGDSTLEISPPRGGGFGRMGVTMVMTSSARPQTRAMPIITGATIQPPITRSLPRTDVSGATRAVPQTAAIQIETRVIPAPTRIGVTVESRAVTGFSPRSTQSATRSEPRPTPAPSTPATRPERIDGPSE